MGHAERVLVCWVGNNDLEAPERDRSEGVGPIASALCERSFDGALLLNNYPQARLKPYVQWLKGQTTVALETRQQRLDDPTDFGAIYRAVTSALDELRVQRPEARLAFHLSPGTPSMAAVWLILANTRYPAQLIQSSREQGVREVKIPFQITADFVPELTRERDAAIERESAELPPNEADFSQIEHRSSVMKRLIARARRAAHSTLPVLIEGESGTGKELLARAIHRGSPRRDGPLVAVNCGAIPETLLEAQLFGHERGAFTGADRAQKGLVREAHGGTLFLDEIGEMPPTAQVRLLRVLQEGEVLPVGATTPVQVDIRVVAATHRNLMADVAGGRFREDLFYRLAVAILRVPPLREREGDLEMLIDRSLERVNQENAQHGISERTLSVAARRALLGHPWPGNVRELQNTLRRAALWSAKPRISGAEIEAELMPTVHQAPERILDRSLDNGLDLEALLDDVARHYVRRAIEKTGGNKTKAAELVGLASYQTFSNWMERLGV